MPSNVSSVALKDAAAARLIDLWSITAIQITLFDQRELVVGPNVTASVSPPF